MSTATKPALEVVCDALLRSSKAFADLLRQVPDTTINAIGIWSIAETAVHVSQSSPYFLGAAKGTGELENLSDNAATTIAGVNMEQERDVRILADRIVAHESELAAYARGVGGDPEARPFEGLTVPLSAVLAIELGELIVHGWDIARAARLPWAVAPADAALALYGDLHVMPLMLDVQKAGSMRARCQIDIRHGTPVVLIVDDGVLNLEPPSSTPVDCHVSVDPKVFLLMMFNRVSRVRALFTGHIIIWGQKPWAFKRLSTVLKAV